MKRLWFVRQTDGRRQDRLLYWPMTYSLDHNTHLALLLFGQGCSTGGLVWARGPSGLALTDWLSLWPSLSNSLNCRRHLHILFRNAHLLPIRSHDLPPLIYTGASLIDGSIKGQYVREVEIVCSLNPIIWSWDSLYFSILIAWVWIHEANISPPISNKTISCDHCLFLSAFSVPGTQPDRIKQERVPTQFSRVLGSFPTRQQIALTNKYLRRWTSYSHTFEDADNAINIHFNRNTTGINLKFVIAPHIFISGLWSQRKKTESFQNIFTIWKVQQIL